MNILLIGSGRTGRAITKELLALPEINNFYLFSRTSKSAKSLAYDLDDKKVNVVEDFGCCS
jgi:saccharopine dehydrogenase-like NADP-dependent oxidoreductase